jgi:SecD/SecF fusion protein
MRPFFWRFVICLAPVLLAGWVTWHAYENDGFKLGVDLSGGTILVYEIDTRKQQARELEAGGRGDSQADTNLLAEALKRRIDPTATYNIVIRPAGAAGRVEIILPTGGEKRARQAQEKWDKDLAQLKDVWHLKELEVGRGKVQELVDRIQSQVAEHTWATKVFNTPQAWNDLLAKAENKWLQLKVEMDPNLALADPMSVTSVLGVAANPGQPKVSVLPAVLAEARIKLHLNRLRPGQVTELIRLLSGELEGVLQERGIGNWVKEMAWNKLQERIRQQQAWSYITKEELEGIPPDSFEELIGRVEAKGNVFAQAALETLRPLVGALPAGKSLNDRQKIIDFITANYGPTPKEVEASISKVTGQEISSTRDLTVEEVQRIKELVARVGSLEFKILANQTDDAQAIKEGEAQLNNPGNKDALDRAAVRGEPPVGPLVPGNKAKLKEYTIELPHNNKSIVTYGWVELGPQERYAMGLDNAARNDVESRRKKIWDYVHQRLGQAIQVPDPTSPDNRYLLQGALFYSRECKDRNMTEEQRRKKQFEYFVLARNPEIDPATGKETPKIDGSLLQGASVNIAEGRPAVSFVFNAKGGELFGTLTGKNVPSGEGSEESQRKRHLAIVLDGLVMSAPTINSRISTHGQITGSFTRKEVDSLVNILRSGALPATLKPQPVSETTIGATLGPDTIRAGVGAIFWSFIAVVVFMIFYYRFAGIVASTALFGNLLLTVGFMVAVHATFTLPGLAGLVLMLGMAVDANVLIYERLREERDRGASLALAIRNGYDRALPIIIDTHLTGIFTAIVMYIVGNDQLKGFGVSLTVGLIISLFTSLYVTRLLFDYWLSRGWLHKLSMARLIGHTDIDFMGIRYYWFTGTVLLTVVGLALFVARLPGDLNIDFVGGTAYGGQLTKNVNMSELRSLLREDRQKELLAVASVKQEDADGHRFKITYKESIDREKSVTVNLANEPPGNTNAEREADIEQRAGILPDLSIEQTFPSFLKAEEGKSPYFTARTSEKETELVQAALDRLLHEQEGGKWVALMKKVAMDYQPAQLEAGKRDITLSFTAYGTGKADYASPSFIKGLFTRDLERTFGDSIQKLPFQFELTGLGTGQEGRYDRIKLAFSPELKGDEVTKVLAALDQTRNAFQARPAPEMLENFDSELASQTRLQAMWAILASWLAIAVYLWFRFGNWTFGLATVLCLIHDLFFTLGIIAFCHYLHGTWLGTILQIEDFKIDLTAVAALLTLVGYSVNDTIVVFDRIREVRGKNPDLTADMINDSVNQTLSRTILTATTVWLVVIVLYLFGGPGVHLFAFVMVVGVVVGTYSSIYVASPLLLMFGEGTRSKTAGLQRQAQPAGATV